MKTNMIKFSPSHFLVDNWT